MEAPRGGILDRTARGASWIIGWRLVTRIMGLASTLTLVRLLAPEDFGLVAMAFGLAGAIEVCLTIGVELQIIRSRAPDRALYDTAFTLNVIRGLLLGLFVAIGAAPAAVFFQDPRLEAVMLVLAVITLCSGLTNIGVVDFQRDLDFGKEFRLMILPRLLQVLVTVAAALLLRSYWALLVGIAAGKVAGIAMSYAIHPYRPRLSLAAWRDLIAISFWIWAQNLAVVLRDRTDSLVIGRMLGTAQVGIYTIGVEIAALLATEVVGPIARACMPGFAASLRQEADAATARSFLRVVALTGLLAVPTGVGISLVAGSVVALALGQSWQEAAPLIAVLGVAYIFISFGLVGTAFLTAHGRMRAIFTITAGAAVVRVALLLSLAAPLGLLGIGIAVGVTLAVENLVVMATALRIVRRSLVSLLGQVWRPVVAALAMALLLRATELGWTDVPPTAASGLQQLAGAALLGASTYVAMVATLWWACGRPDGAEADLLLLLRRIAQAGINAWSIRLPATLATVQTWPGWLVRRGP